MASLESFNIYFCMSTSELMISFSSSILSVSTCANTVTGESDGCERKPQCFVVTFPRLLALRCCLLLVVDRISHWEAQRHSELLGLRLLQESPSKPNISDSPLCRRVLLAKASLSFGWGAQSGASVSQAAWPFHSYKQKWGQKDAIPTSYPAPNK